MKYIHKFQNFQEIARKGKQKKHHNTVINLTKNFPKTLKNK